MISTFSSALKRLGRTYRSDGAISTLTGVTGHIESGVRQYVVAARLGDSVTIRGVELDLEGVPIGRTMAVRLYEGGYEENEAEAIDAYVSPDMDVVDLGAGLGYTSCVANRRISEDSTHVAVEANPRLGDVLRKNRDQNDCDFEVVSAGYDPVAATLELAPTQSAWAASAHLAGDVVAVDTVDLETLVSRFRVSDAALVVDIEGHEAELLEYELDILESHFEVLVVEFHDRKEELTEKRRTRIADARDRLSDSAFEHVEDSGDIAVFSK